jgi:peptidoglycan/LPS O-acetylase OafA/YrhL
VRRTLRIFPLYFLVVFIGFAIVTLGNQFGELQLHQLPEFTNFLFFVLNFYMMNHGLNFLFFLTFFWSVSVEEQFYIFWAVILKFFSKFDVLMSVILIVSSLVFRAVNLESDNRLVFHTLSSLGNFGLGCLLCKYFFYQKEKAERMVNAISLNAKRMIYILALVSFIWYNNLFTYSITIIFERIIYAFFFCFVIADLAFSKTPTFNLEKSKFMNYFGQLSFGLYCYHGIVMTMVFYFFEKYELTENPIFVFGVTPIILFLLTLVMAHLSYRFFEKPIVLLKRKFY